MKIAPNSVWQRIVIFSIVLELIFEISPSVFDTVFVRRISRQPNNVKAIESGDLLKDRLSVPRSVVHEDDAVASQLRTQIPFEPYLKPSVFCAPVENNRHDYFIVTFSGNDVQPFLSLARSFHIYAFSSRSAGSLSDNMTFYSALINIYERSIARQFCYLRVKRRPFFLIALGIGYCSFFKVIFSRSNASNAPDGEPPNSLAISANVASGFSAM